MAAIDITLANLALQKIGATDIVVDAAQDSEAARTIRNAWDDVRRSTIRGTADHRPRWNFARRYFELAARVPTTEWPVPQPWVAVYPLPAQSLRFLEIVSPDDAKLDYDLIAGPDGMELAIRSDAPLCVWCLVDVPEPARWDATFRTAFAAHLGWQIADRITGDRGRKQDCWQDFEQAMKAATGADSSEGTQVKPEEDDWIASRFTGTGYGMRGLAR